MASASRKTARTKVVRSVRVRMYRVGFGDCFLITLRGAREDHVLVDCGVHASGRIGTLEAVVEDVAKVTGKRLAVVIASHAHEDHISGFVDHAAAFRQFRIGEVWLPWTEDPRDRKAAKLRRKQAKLLARLQAHFAARPPSDLARHALANLAESRNRPALDNLRAAFGTGATVRFLEAGARIDAPGGVAGLSATLLGPPRDEAFLRKMDPPKAERFLELGGGDEPVLVDGSLLPFTSRWKRAADAGPTLSAQDEALLKEMAEASLEGLAFSLTRARNNTSLVVLLAWRGVNLLFPGDAQFGSWKSWMDDEELGDSLRTIDFYKCSHHGSENATPKSALENMGSGRLAAMVSTQSKPFPSIPETTLMKALDARTKSALVRSDVVPVPEAPEGPAVAKLPAGFTRGKLWVDWVLRA